MARKPLAVFLFLLFCSFFLFDSIVLGSHELEYRIDVYVDGSARWVIEHRFLLESEDDETLFKQYSNWTYFSEYLIKNVKALVNSVSLKTARNMTVENFKMTVDVFDSYRVVRYEFDWIRFAEETGSRIKIGDAFEVEGLFLYGDGTLNMTFPTDYMVEIVSPEPSDESEGTLKWNRVEDFGRGQPTVVFGERVPSALDTLKPYVPVILVIVALAGTGSIGMWFYRFRKKKKREAIGPVPSVPPATLGIVDDEEKVVTLLRSAGGRLFQSTLTDQCGFSRSKTSKLLSSMEEKRKIRRQKKGREKVVILISEFNESERPKNEERMSY